MPAADYTVLVHGESPRVCEGIATCQVDVGPFFAEFPLTVAP